MLSLKQLVKVRQLMLKPSVLTLGLVFLSSGLFCHFNAVSSHFSVFMYIGGAGRGGGDNALRKVRNPRKEFGLRAISTPGT